MNAGSGGASPALHGVLPVDKPSGPTSHDIVAQARRHFRTRSVGHAGTLDPMASGVLVLLFGEGTKLSNVVTGGDKTYRARIELGRSTDSHDAQGRTLSERELAPDALDEQRLRAALASEASRVTQVPPSVSAIKVAGERAYRLHHAGKPPELDARAVAVRSLTLLERSAYSFTLELCVSKGYYVRGLARDLELALELPLHLAELRRTASGCFALEHASPWPPPSDTRLITLERALRAIMPVRRLTAEGVVRARQGKLLDVSDFIDDPRDDDASHAQSPLCAWISDEGIPVALGRPSDDKFAIVRGFSAAVAPGG
jgi:tRNA pseudouridine55 synthase